MERRLAFSWMEGFSPCSTMRHMPLYTRSKSTHACYTWWSVVSPPTAMCKRDTLTTHTGQHQKARKIYDTGNTLHEPGAKKTHMHAPCTQWQRALHLEKGFMPPCQRLLTKRRRPLPEMWPWCKLHSIFAVHPSTVWGPGRLTK